MPFRQVRPRRILPDKEQIDLYHPVVVQSRARRLLSQIARAYRRSNHPVTYREAWLTSVVMLVPAASVLYVLTWTGHTLLDTRPMSLLFAASFATYICVLTGLLSSYKIHRRRPHR